MSTPLAPTKNDLYGYTLRQADNSMVLCQRLCQWAARGPELEEDIGLTNIGLDLIGQARSLYQYSASLCDRPVDENDLAFLRDPHEWSNLLLVEQPNGDFADTIARQYCYDAWHLPFLEQLTASNDTTLAAIAAKSVKEARYHVRHSSMWVKRLGDGTEVSHRRMQDAITAVWPFIAEMFIADELDQRMLEIDVGVDLRALQSAWESQVSALLANATLSKPIDVKAIVGGRQGQHTEHLDDLLLDMQALPRSMPNHQW